MSLLFDALTTSNDKLDTYNRFIAQNAIAKRWLLNAILELTPVCNLKCKMCYVRMSDDEVKQAGKHIMLFDEWRVYIDELAALGVHNFTLTGGECTVHPDFCKIYKYIYQKGCVISIMTNGSNLTDEILEMFASMPPAGIRITVYGCSEKTYESFCSNRSAYRNVIDGVDKLVNIGITPVLQTTVCGDNLSDLYGIYEFAKSRELPFLSVDLLTCYDKCTAEKIDAVKAEHSEYERVSKEIWRDMHHMSLDEYDKVKSTKKWPPIDAPIIKKGVPCNAGRSLCSINWQGEMQPCNTFDAYKKDPRTVGFKECWNELMAWADNVPRFTECQRCIHQLKCRQCMALHYNDTHELGKPSPRLCYKIAFSEEAKKDEAEYEEYIASK